MRSRKYEQSIENEVMYYKNANELIYQNTGEYMNQKLQFKITISDEKKEICSLEMSFNEIQDLINYSDDSKRNEMLFEFAASHPSEVVRENIAYKDSINEKTWNILAKDSSINVLRRLVATEASRKYVTLEHLKKWIKLDVEIARTIANYLGNYEQVDIDELADILHLHSDPSVVAELANNSDSPRKLLKELTKYPDARVSSNAKSTLG